jgi:hypothetical protein
MLIQLTKGKDEKPGALTCVRDDGALTCVRDDGSRTWQPSTPYFARHDLIHYAVETILNYTEAFWGLVAQGKDLDDFGTKRGRKDVYTLQEIWAENLVGILQWPSVGGGPALTAAEQREMLAKTCADHGIAAPDITAEQLAGIEVRVAELHAQWDRTPAGETMTLTF